MGIKEPTTLKLNNHNSNASKKKRVLVAMSGGVDSSVAAALLVEQGYDVVGITMQVWDYTQCEIDEGNGTCCSSIDVDDARSVADKIEIPFYVMNCEAKFKQEVIQPFIKDYLRGKTPLPCVNCNTYLKFDHLFKKMKELECDYLATGHYAKIVKNENGVSEIVTSTDDWKDQTYFLFTLRPDLLKYLLFPIGNMQKPDVRAYAQEKGLINARKKDSVGICFIGKQGYSNFINQHANSSDFKMGDIKSYPSGEIVGKHEGIHNFTYGQRKGFGAVSSKPMYVLDIDAETGTVWVGEEKYLYKESLELKDFNTLANFDDKEQVRVKIRYQHPGAVAKIRKENDRFFIDFEKPQRAITPGQAAVVYKDKKLLGGGWIIQ